MEGFAFPEDGAWLPPLGVAFPPLLQAPSWELLEEAVGGSREKDENSDLTFPTTTTVSADGSGIHLRLLLKPGLNTPMSQSC